MWIPVRVGRWRPAPGTVSMLGGDKGGGVGWGGEGRVGRGGMGDKGREGREGC